MGDEKHISLLEKLVIGSFIFTSAVASAGFFWQQKQDARDQTLDKLITKQTQTLENYQKIQDFKEKYGVLPPNMNAVTTPVPAASTPQPNFGDQ